MNETILLTISICCNVFQFLVFGFFWLGYLNIFKELKELREYKKTH